MKELIYNCIEQLPNITFEQQIQLQLYNFFNLLLEKKKYENGFSFYFMIVMVFSF